MKLAPLSVILLSSINFLVLLGNAGASPSTSTASWSNVASVMDSYPNIDNAIFIVANSNGIVFNHTKGNLVSSTHLSVASASKWVSATIIYRMVEDGYIHLNDSPSKYLSWWTTNSQDSRSLVTLSLLLAFTSGTGADNSCVGDANYNLESCAQSIYNNSFVYTPGTNFYYGGNHLQIAGAMAVNAYNQAFPNSNAQWITLFNKYISTPLGMSTSLTLYTPQANPNLAGGLYISTDDYLKFLLATLNKSILKQASYTTMLTDNTLPPVNLAYSPVSVATPPQSWNYCQGNWIECELPSFDKTVCINNNVHSSPGKFGFYPRIDYVNGYLSIVARSNVALLAYVYSVEFFQAVEGNVTALMQMANQNPSTINPTTSTISTTSNPTTSTNSPTTGSSPTPTPSTANPTSSSTPTTSNPTTVTTNPATTVHPSTSSVIPTTVTQAPTALPTTSTLVPSSYVVPTSSSPSTSTTVIPTSPKPTVTTSVPTSPSVTSSHPTNGATRSTSWLTFNFIFIFVFLFF